MEDGNSDSKRKLASIQKVVKITAHPNPDVERLELATVLGWQVVVAKGEVAVGDVVVYCEIDSLLPAASNNVSWLPPAVQAKIEKQKKNKEWYRVKTACIMGALSQGLIVSAAAAAAAAGLFSCDEEKQIGLDVTNVLGIRKYEPVAFTGKWKQSAPSKNGGAVVPFPNHLLPKTDENRIQSNPWLLEKLQGKPFYATVKLDGTSATYLIDPSTREFRVCSRNMVRDEPKNTNTCLYFKAAADAKIKEKLQEHPHLAIQGEICGPGIQKNPLGLKDVELFVFNVVDITTKRRLPFQEMQETCRMLNLKTVPIEMSAESFPPESYAAATVDRVLEMAKGKYGATGKHREGLVFRSMCQSISFKAINNDFLCSTR